MVVCIINLCLKVFLKNDDSKTSIFQANFYYKNCHFNNFVIGPLVIKDPDTGVHTIIGVTQDAPYTYDEYLQGQVSTFSRVSTVLSWINKITQNPPKGLSFVIVLLNNISIFKIILYFN